MHFIGYFRAEYFVSFKFLHIFIVEIQKKHCFFYKNKKSIFYTQNGAFRQRSAIIQSVFKNNIRLQSYCQSKFTILSSYCSISMNPLFMLYNFLESAQKVDIKRYNKYSVSIIIQ
jgi:hypothetical protein